MSQCKISIRPQGQSNCKQTTEIEKYNRKRKKTLEGQMQRKPRTERKTHAAFTVLKSCQRTNLKRDVVGKVNSTVKFKYHWHNRDRFKQAVHVYIFIQKQNI